MILSVSDLRKVYSKIKLPYLWLENDNLKYIGIFFKLQAQSYCLKHMILSVPDLRKVYSEIKLSEVIVMMIDRLPEKQLDESKINTIKDIVHCPLFENSQCREILLPAMASHVRYVGFTLPTLEIRIFYF